MSRIDKKAVATLAKESEKELHKATKRWKEKRVTKLARLSKKSHHSVKRLSIKKKMTMSKTLDFIIKKFIKNQEYDELD